MHDYLFYGLAAAGWLQTVAALISTYSKTMIRLRFASVIANALGVIGNLLGGNWAALVRHALILPIDIIRLREMRRLIASVKQASDTDLNTEWLKPFMHPRHIKAGEVLFRKGEPAREAFVLVEGEITLPEVNVVLKTGVLFGEMALFTVDGLRTASAVAQDNSTVLAITYEQLEQLYFQNPRFGLYLIRLIARRYQANLNQIEAGLGQAGK